MVNKQTKQEYKKTEVGIIPKEWNINALGGISNLITNGFVGVATPYYSNDSTAINYLMSNNVRPNKIDFSKLVKVTNEFNEKHKKSILEEGDMLTVQSGHIGTSCIVDKELKGANCHALIITRFKDEINPSFISQYLNSHIGMKRLSNIFVGSTIKHINVKDFKKFVVPLPPLAEQHKIATILTTVDDAIEKTEAIIKQTEVVKQGVMQRLFSKGIGNNKFKHTEIGKIPENWNVKKAREIANVEYGISESVSANTDPSIGIPILTGANITLDGKLGLSKIVYIQKKENERFELKKGDLLFNWRSGSQHHVGKTAIFDLDGDYTYASFMLRLRMLESNNYRFFYHLLNYLKTIGYFSKDTSMQVNFKLNATTFRELLLPCPPRNEQKKIADILDSVTKKVNVEQRRLKQLDTIKSALMQNLLTGKVRVNVDVPSEVSV
jgi:type I restriction enzyme S subunit